MQFTTLNDLVTEADIVGLRTFPKRSLRAETLCLTISCVPVDILPEELEYLVDKLKALGWR